MNCMNSCEVTFGSSSLCVLQPYLKCAGGNTFLPQHLNKLLNLDVPFVKVASTDPKGTLRGNCPLLITGTEGSTV